MAMLKNKKKLRRLARMTSGTAGRALLTLAVAGMLVSPAMAAGLTQWTGLGTHSVSDGIKYIDSSITVNGEATVKGAVHGRPTVDGTPGGGWTSSLIFGSSADVTIASDSNNTTYPAQIQVDAFTANGGKLTISGIMNGSTKWDEGSQLVVGLNGSNSTITGTKITLGDYGQLVQASKDASKTDSGVLTITGATISMEGASADKAGILRASSGNGTTTKPAKLVLKDSTINVVAEKSGVIASRETTLDDSKLIVNGNLNIYGGLISGKTVNASGAGSTAVADKFTMNGGELTVAKNASMKFEGTLTLNNVTSNINGVFHGEDDGISTGSTGGDWRGNLVVDGGTFNVNSVSGGGVAMAQFDGIKISNAKMNIGLASGATAVTKWQDGPMMVSTAGDGTGLLNISKSEIALGDNGQLVGGKKNGNVLTHTIADSTIAMNGSSVGKEALLRAAAAHASISGTTNHSTFALSNTNISVDTDKHGVILSRATTMNGGTLDVKGSLTVAGATERTTVLIVPGMSAATSKWGSFTATGTTITVGDTAKLDFATNNVDLTLAGNGTLTAKDIKVASGAGATGLSAAKMTVNGGTVNATNLVQDAGGTLTITGGAVNVAENFTNATASSGVVVSGGNLALNGSKILASGGKGLATGVAKIGVSGTGTVTLAHTGEALTLDELKTLKGNLVGAGNWSITGVNVSDLSESADDTKAADGTTQKTLSASDTMTVGAALAKDYGVAVTGSTPTLSDSSVSGNLVVGGTVTGTKVEISTAANQTNTIIGKDGALVAGAGTKTTDLKVGTDSQLNLGSTAVAGGGTLNGSITSAGKADVAVNNGEFAVKGDVSLATTGGKLALNEGGALTVGGNVTADTLAITGGSLAATTEGKKVTTNAMTLTQGSTLAAKSLELNGTAHAIDSGSVVDVTELKVKSGNTITVGSTDGGAGTLIATSATLNGAEVFLDPAWKGNDEIKNASQAAIGGTKIDGMFTVGQNSWVAFGTTDVTAMPNAFASTKINGTELVWGDGNITAAAGIFKPQTLDTTKGGILVDGSVDATKFAAGSKAVANTVTLANNSLLVVDYAGLYNATTNTYNPAITLTNGTVTIAQDSVEGTHDGAKLLLVNAKVAQPVTIFMGANTASAVETNAFATDHIVFSNYGLYADSAAWGTGTSAGTYVVTPKFNMVAYDALRSNGMSAGAGDVMLGYFKQFSTLNTFMETALNRDIYLDNTRQMAMNLEAGLDIARAADLRGSAISTVDSSVATVMNRSSFGYVANGISSGDSSLSFGLWGNPAYSHNETSSKINGSGFRVKADSDSFGGIIGADVTWNENLRVGAAFNVGTGDTKAKHDNISTKNSFSYVGGALYGSYLYDRFAFSGVVGYTSFDNKVTQDMAGISAQLKAKPDTSIWNVGVEGKYTHTFSNGVNLVPSLGIEWLHVKQSSFTTAMNGHDMIHVGGVNTNIIRFPMRLAVNKDFQMGNGVLTPEARVAFIPSTGNKMNTSVSLVNVPGARGTMNGISPDNAAGEIGFGLTGKFNNFSISAGYDFQFSQNQNNHRVNAMLRYQF